MNEQQHTILSAREELAGIIVPAQDGEPEPGSTAPDSTAPPTDGGGAGEAPVPPPASGGCGAAKAGEGERSLIYALGTIEVRFPSLAIEKELAQAVRDGGTANLTDGEVVYQALRDNRHLAREVCWVLTVEGLEVYLLMPSDPQDLDRLVEAVQPATRGIDCDVVIGTRGPLAPPQMCNGLAVPIVLVDQIYSFDVPALIEAIPKPKGIEEKQFRAAAEELFHRIQQLADNVGAMPEHRAINYLAVRYPRVYDLVAEQHGADRSLTWVDVHPSRLSGARRLYDVVLAFTHRKTDVMEKFYVRVDVTEKYPFLASKLAPFYDRV